MRRNLETVRSILPRRLPSQALPALKAKSGKTQTKFLRDESQKRLGLLGLVGVPFSSGFHHLERFPTNPPIPHLLFYKFALYYSPFDCLKTGFKMKLNYKSSRFILFALIWVILIGFAVTKLEAYSNTPGDDATAPAQWPKESHLGRDSSPTLLVFLHPECPCSEVTVGELNRLITKIHDKAKIYAVFIQPEGWSQKKVQGHLWKEAQQIPSVKPVFDAKGYETELFGALTSGQTLLYDKNGKLIFSGGITGSRGHMGDNVGESAIVDLLTQKENNRVSLAKVFGCGLFEKNKDEFTK